MNMFELKCCMHLSKVPDSLPIRIFTDKTLAQCHSVANHGRLHNLKHKYVMLPDRVNTVDGYHVSCYRNFTGIVIEKIDNKASDAEGKKILLSLLFIVRIENNDIKFLMQCFNKCTNINNSTLY